MSLPTNLSLQLLTAQQRSNWDDLVQAVPQGCFMQSWAWADFKELEGYKTFRYGLFTDTDDLVGGCIFHFYPHHSQANLLISPGGPILTEPWVEIGMKLLLQQAEKLASTYGAIALRVEPLLTEKPTWLNSEFVRAPSDLMPSETLLINLQISETEMLAAMKSKGRYNLRLSGRYGVTTEFTTDDRAIPQLYDLFWETVERQNFWGEPYGFFINLCRTLFTVNMAEIGLATWQGQTLAAILVVYWGDRCTYLYGGRTDQHPEVMASYALHWAAMQRAKQRNCKVYDFYGFSTDSNHAYAKFSRFKRQFGGTVVKTMGAHDYFFYDHLADTIIGLLQQVIGNC